jgi:thiol-disulfide isomerase/thioredoxin
MRKVRALAVSSSASRFAALLALVFVAALLVGSLSVAAPSTPAKAPDFKLPLKGGNDMALSQLRGQVVMINFWASWCGPCRQEMPLLETIHKKYKPMGFTMLGVNVEPDSKLADDFLKKTPVSFPVAYDRESKVSKLFRVQGMPSTVIVDRKGNVRVVHKGYKPGDENTYLTHIRSLIRE